VFKHKGRIIINLIVVLAFVLAFNTPSFAQGQGPGQQFQATPLTPDSTFTYTGPKPVPVPSYKPGTGTVSVVVKLKGDPLATYSGGVTGLAPTSPRVTGAPQLDPRSKDSQAYLQHLAQLQNAFESKALKAVPQAKSTHRFDILLNAISMLVPADQVKTLAALPDVEAVYPDELLQLDTDNSPQFIGAPTVWKALGGQEKAGEGVIVGVLDTGIWPEHPSFSDPDPSGKPYAPLASWHGTKCEFGSAVPGDVPFTCNNKLVGAAQFMATYSALQTRLPDEYLSARDDDGHGTHTSSTAAGNANVAASIFGISRGTISGIAPRARVAMYKVCGVNGCYSSDSAAAVQQAILDGVNVINFSIGGGSNPFSDAVEQAFLDAYDAGIFVAASAGNSGPTPDTTDHRGPWVTTVAASTQNRAFQNTLTVTGDGGASLTLNGTSLTKGVGPAPVFVPTGTAADLRCDNPLAAGSVAGKIVVCQRGNTGRAQKGWNVLQGGAVGMILYNQSTSVTDVETDNHFLPTTHIQYVDGQALLSFIAANTNVQATLTQGVKVSAQGDVMASFSSRGGPNQTLGVSKPDITAPGVQILAGASPQHLAASEDPALGPQGEWFQAIAGTSMSSPHIAGAGALLKALHPDWTPGKIKSALMTTAWTQVVKEDGVTPANAFDYGSGRVDLTKAGSVGLTFDETAANYVAHQNDLWNANYPSVYVPVMPGVVTVQRTAHSELKQTSCWLTSVDSPSDVKVFVLPVICVKGGGNQTFSIMIDGHSVPLGETRFATLNLKFGKQQLHMPLTFVRKQPVVTLTKTCDPATIAFKGTTNCTITMVNTSFSTAAVNLLDIVPLGLQVVKGSVVGGSAFGNIVSFKGSLAGALPPDISIGPGSTPAGGYLPLSAFGVGPIAGVGDDTVTNFNVPAFVYGGQTYTRLGVGSNGVIIVGGSTGSSDATPTNQRFPDPTRPNNVLALFWSDLNPAAGGAVRIATLTDGTHHWIVVDWDTVKEFSSAKYDTFEVWIGYDGVQDTSYAYGPIGGNGDNGLLTVGAENVFGNRGANYYYNGTGTLPADGTQLVVTGAAPSPGETHTVTFSATGFKPGDWTNCAMLTGDIFFGTNTACFTGQTSKP
jgi:subtilisin family serine protease